MTASKNIFSILFAMLMVSCSYSSLRPEVVDRSDAQRMQTVILLRSSQSIELYYLEMEILVLWLEQSLVELRSFSN